MDQKVEEEEPVWCEGTASTSFLLADVKNEILVEEQAVGQLVPYLKEEDNVENIAVATIGVVESSSSSCKVPERASGQICLSPTDHERPHCCHVCDEQLLSHSGKRSLHRTRCISLKSKIKIQRTHRCNECSKTFYTKSNLYGHMLTHTGERPFVCKECGSAFYHKGTLNTHVLTHSGERSYCCNECGVSCSTLGNLNVHMKIHARKPLNRDRLFYCDTCGKSFFVKSNLRRHCVIHTLERPHVCNTCGVTFPYKSTLVRHMRIHSGNRPFSCNECGKTFSAKYTLHSHLLTHTRKRPHSCGECSETFSLKHHLVSHLLSHSRVMNVA